MTMVFDEPDTPLSPWWRHAAVLVAIVAFAVLGIVTGLAYKNEPPIPRTVADSAGRVLFTRADILNGQSVFLKYDLMEHGTLWGHGAYLGPDYSAEYLHSEANDVRDYLAEHERGAPYAALDPADQEVVAHETRLTLKRNRYVAATGTLVLTPGEVASFERQIGEWTRFFDQGKAPGLPQHYIKDPRELRSLTAYFAWAGWVTVADRPGEDYSYTNNWPFDPAAGNHPSAAAYLWSALSLVTLLGGLGLILFLFGKFDFLGWSGGDPAKHETHPPAAELTPSQWATGRYFVVVAALFLLQTLVGGALAHYDVEPFGFYGLHLANVLPYNLLRTWHLQLAIFWIATAWVGGGLFLAPMVGGREPRHQAFWVNVLLGALAIVVIGSLAGEWLGINDKLGALWFWLGDQGSEYLDLGRIWQYLLAAGLGLWLVLMYRALKPAIKHGSRKHLASLFLYAAVAIPVFYVPALFYGPHTNFTVIDTWRFWIIHLWVEGFFELFATVLVGIMFTKMGVVSAKTATRLVYLDAILYLGAGVIGTGHHWYFTGQTTLNMALAACFSAMEIVPLTLLTLDAWDFIKLSRVRCAECGEDLAAGQKWSIYFLIAVGVWNFVGAGVFGFLINLPIISYFEIGTTLTANHAHAAMFGVFGMLALGVLVFCMREMQSDKVWERTARLVKVGFWGLNVGLGLMVLLDLFPAGLLQLWDSVSHGYWHARELTYLMNGPFHELQWLRIVADVTFIAVGVVPTVLAALRSYARRDVAHGRA